jgi:membrane dipeptidase
MTFQFAVLIERGWSASDLVGLAGGNFLRVLEGVERVARQMKAEEVRPSMMLYGKRPDLPMKEWVQEL